MTWFGLISVTSEFKPAHSLTWHTAQLNELHNQLPWSSEMQGRMPVQGLLLQQCGSSVYSRVTKPESETTGQFYI